MTATSWAAIGLTAAAIALLATALFAMLARLDAPRGDLGGRMDALGSDLRSELGGRIGQLGSDLRSDLGGRIDAQAADIRELRVAVQDLDRRLSRTGG